MAASPHPAAQGLHHSLSSTAWTVALIQGTVPFPMACPETVWLVLNHLSSQEPGLTDSGLLAVRVTAGSREARPGLTTRPCPPMSKKGTRGGTHHRGRREGSTEQ